VSEIEAKDHRHVDAFIEDAESLSLTEPELSQDADQATVREPEPESVGVVKLRLVGALLVLLRLGPLLILGALVLIMSNLSPVFATTQNVGNVLAQSAVIAILAIGQLLVILTRGIDLSVGSTLALSSVVGAMVFSSTDGGALTVLAMLGTGAAVGAVNGLVLVYGKLPHPFIITLATLSVARGLALGLSEGQPIRGMPDIVGDIGGGTATWLAAWLPNSTFLVIGVAVVVTVFLTRIVWGRWIYAVGGNPDGARRLGIPRSRVLVSVYVLSGLLAGVAAIVTSGRLNAGSPTFGDLAELDAIAAVVIGGASFLGGRGHVGHALVGAFMIGVIRNGMNLLNIEAYLQLIVIGVVIVIAVESDVLRQRLESRFRVLKAAAE
jgi:ribose transport system permease protein